MVRPSLFAATAAAALLPAMAAAQDHGMTMPMPTADRIPAPATATPSSPPDPHPASAMPGTTGADHPGMNHAGMNHPATDHDAMDHGAMPGMAAMGFTAPDAWRTAAGDALAHAPAGTAMPGMAMGTSGGWYGQGSGTARLPAAEGPMRGYMTMAGDWMLMAHGYAWGVATVQGGPRGRDEVFVESMAMLMADRDLGPDWHLQLRGMGSLEPAMGARGYPNLFATGEVADGSPLVDRQHPHDLVMELAAKLDYRVGGGATIFVYGGPVGEPALGPSAFMHRGSARYLPLSPITHHWFDSTHITYGVVTAGYAAPQVQLEASAFKGREPDEHRWNIETPRLDSWSMRATWTPSPYWAMQVSHGFLKTPEEQHPGENEHRTTASVQYARAGIATTLAYSLKDRSPGEKLSAFLAEATWEITPRHAVFGRIENVANDELFPDEAATFHDRTFRVTKAEAGYAYRLPIVGPLGVALGGTVAAYAKPTALDAAYGDDPASWTLFAKLALGL
jgi:hypothetical protein